MAAMPLLQGCAKPWARHGSRGSTVAGRVGSLRSCARKVAKCACASCRALPRSSPRRRRLRSSQSIYRSACRNRRTADNAVRSLLGARRSSVFSVPSRRAVFAEGGPFDGQQSRWAAHQRACAVARETSVPPRSITIFAFAIFSKIREVDEVLQSDRALHGRVRETHPELAFWRLNGARPLASAKKTEAGLALRRRLLIEAGLAPAIVNGAPPKGAGRDDLLDALACAAIAARIHRGLARPVPDPPERGACGLPMAIWA